MADHKDCQYCAEHGLYGEAKWLDKTGNKHAVNQHEQLQLFSDRQFNGYDPNAGAAINPGS